MKRAIMIAAMIAAFGLGGAAAFAGTSDKPPSPPGQPDCEHGNSQKPCKEDPQPDHGNECDEHGNKGGQNEDHCITPTETTPTETTPTETTPTDTTPTDTTPTDTTSDGTSSNESSPQEGAAESSPAETTSSPEASGQVYAPPASQAQGEEKSQSVASASVSASQPSTAPQRAPFTP